jgi:hypothetical protein
MYLALGLAMPRDTRKHRDQASDWIAIAQTRQRHCATQHAKYCDAHQSIFRARYENLSLRRRYYE